MDVKLNHLDITAIEAFVAAHPQATQGHRPAWMSVMTDGLGHRPLALTAWEGETIVGWLPLVETRSMIFGRRLVSMPYLNEAGVLATNEAAAHALLEHAKELATERGIATVELRQREAISLPALDRIRTDKVRMTLPLPGESTALWDTIASKARNQIRKARKNPLNITFGGVELLNDFYAVFSENMRDLGTPAYPRQLFAAILEHLGNDAELCIVDLAGIPVACALLVHGRGVTEVPSASSLRSHNDTCANMLMYWSLLERAITRGSAEFDFGRSTIDSGPYQFKKQWGAIAQPTGWQQLSLVPGGKPITADDHATAVEIWKKLPIWLTRRIGPMIARGIP